MYCFVDESGNTGLNLFDESQPVLYYGVITSKLNLDVIAEPMLRRLRRELRVQRLHANELGVGRLSNVALEIAEFSKTRDIRFSLFKVSKPDHAIISFFDQVFDSGVNKAVAWLHYWTPLRYILLFKVAYLFDDETAKKAWDARQEVNHAKCSEQLEEICSTLLNRVNRLPDQRSRELVSGGLKWASANPFEIGYGVGNKDTALQISPNLVGFQQVLEHIGKQAARQSRKVRSITVDRQSQFNKAQEELADYYRAMKGCKGDTGPGMPKFDWSNMPTVSPNFCSVDESAGLELVDLTLWIAKRKEEGRSISSELEILFAAQSKRGLTDEVSLKGLDMRWRHLTSLPAPAEPLPAEVTELFDRKEQERLDALQGL